MVDRVISGSLLIVAVIHLLPAVGFLSGDRVGALYGVNVADANLEILLRHRAVLFALLGGFLVVAAFNPAFQPLAFVAAAVNMASFLVLAYTVGGYNAAISKVVLADWIAGGVLLIGLAFYRYQQA